MLCGQTIGACLSISGPPGLSSGPTSPGTRNPQNLNSCQRYGMLIAIRLFQPTLMTPALYSVEPVYSFNGESL